jgi:hypothetical protein
MKLFTDGTVGRKLMRGIEKARERDYTPLYIALSSEEYHALCDGPHSRYLNRFVGMMRKPGESTGAYTVERRSFPIRESRRGTRQGERFNVDAHDHFMAVPIFIVPHFCRKHG